MVRGSIITSSEEKQTSPDAYCEEALRKQNFSHELWSVSEKLIAEQLE